jgi:hypothetical protein
MMPLFPPPPLKFRKVGFPDYGFKVGMSDSAFPRSLSLKPAPGIHDCSVGLHPSFARPQSDILIPFCAGRMILDPCHRSGFRLAPGVLAPVRVIVSRSINT